MKDQVYIGTIDRLQVDVLRRLPVAMFALIDHASDFLEEKQSERKMLMYVYVEPTCRGLGFGKQIIEKAIALAKKSGATLLVLDTLNPRLNHLYEKHGAKVICESRLFSEPTDVLSIKL
jgi:diamine N-acetyltransferase